MDQAAIKNTTFKTLTIKELEVNLPKVCSIFFHLSFKVNLKTLHFYNSFLGEII